MHQKLQQHHYISIIQYTVCITVFVLLLGIVDMHLPHDDFLQQYCIAHDA